MPVSVQTPVRAPNIQGWPWKRASPNVYWRIHLGHRIKMRRQQLPSDMPSPENLHMSQDSLARHLGVSTFTVWEIENGICGIDGAMLAQLAEILHVHPGWFFDVEPLPDWVDQVEQSRFLYRLSAMMAPLKPSEFDIIETVFRYLARRRSADALS